MAGRSQDWLGKTVVVTGGSSGIGAQVVRQFAERGATVFNLDRDLRHPSDDLNNSGSSIVQIATDVSDPESVLKALEHVRSAAGIPDVLVNAAGIYPSHTLVTMEDENWSDVLNVNLRGPFLTMRWLARAVSGDHAVDRSNLNRRVINISSGAARTGRAGAGHYCASKAGLEMLTKVAALEFADLGIAVNGVAPGLIATPGTADLSPDFCEILVQGQPVHRFGESDEVARATLFLADPATTFITGTVIDVDGGFMAGRPLPVA
ncbi:3-oxoacyl-[acyl-carrier-protein] reductase [Nocardioides endophyticus]|uniref:3-oxoacyl-[acyl-carrier-protein] reductase n=2 Tax=Nocardioides endophyticus TaxID=1353775 RepID=A0ABP8Z0E8_9ACTN